MFNPKNIIFDLGGVILNINYNATLNAFKKLGWENIDSLYSQASQSLFFENYEKGLISDEEFITFISSYFENSISDHQITEAWNAMLLDLPIQRLNLLLNIKEHYNLYLLSNTNDIHLNHIKNKYPKDHIHILFHSIFKKLYFSNEIHMKKPDKEIFEYVLQNHDLIPEETLFIDDSIQHLKTASSMGIRTFFMQEQTMEQIFTSKGILQDITLTNYFS